MKALLKPGVIGVPDLWFDIQLIYRQVPELSNFMGFGFFLVVVSFFCVCLVVCLDFLDVVWAVFCFGLVFSFSGEKLKGNLT